MTPWPPKHFNPASPWLATRHWCSRSTASELSQGQARTAARPKARRKSGGRGGHGRTAVRLHGGGGRQRRPVPSSSTSPVAPSRARPTVVAERLEYDPEPRTACIALLKYQADGELAYILAPQRLAAPATRSSPAEQADVKPGNALAAAHAIPVGTIIHNVELKPAAGGQDRPLGRRLRPAGRSSDAGYAQVQPDLRRAPHGARPRVHGHRSAPVLEPRPHSNQQLGKAGRSRSHGPAPASVRGVAMNPVDHPHGGGEGRTSGGRHLRPRLVSRPRAPRPRVNKATDKFIIRSRHKAKKGR
ncbi:50S ribosomal protein L2 [Caulobacter segnis]